MAAELAIGALGPAVEVVKLVTKPIIRQFNYLCCFTSNINSLKDEAKKLNDALAGLEEEVEIARDNVQEPVPEVKTWLTESNKIKVEINGILNEATNVGNGCLKLVARFSLSKKAKKTTDLTKELRGEKKFEVKFQQGPPVARQAVEFRKTYEFESRNKIEEDIMTTLRGGDLNMIGIYGMGGLGKTTMAKKLMNKALKENVFDEVVIATISQNVDKSKIQDEIGGQLGLGKLKDERSESARVQILHARLSDTKRILLVLDDVWERLVLEDFGIPCDSKGCTILLTSRNSDVLRAMDVQIFGMKVLSEEEAWLLFREGAGTCVDDRKLNPIAKEVAKECGGLPIALAVLGLGLKHQNNAAIWKNTLRELKQRVPDTVQFEKEVYNTLKWSYDFLKSKPAKSLFLLCCLFPEDADIPVDYLTTFCLGLGIFKGITNMEDARNKRCALIEFLKDRSLLLDSDKEDCVRMHDVVRDVCIFTAKEEGYIGKDGCTWISSSHLVDERNQLLSGSRCPNLDLLVLNSRYNSWGFKFDDAFLEGIRELYVLCIERYSLKTLPYPTQSLGKLNTLILDSCDELETISVVGKLVNLEILICRNCHSIEKLPSEVKGLNRLKLLELTSCRKLQSIGQGIISSLVGLEELKMLWSFNKWEAEDREERDNAGLRELEALPNLSCLEIDIHDPSLVTKSMHFFLLKKIVRFIIRNDIGEDIYFRSIPSKFSKAMSLCLERETRLGDWIEMQLLRDTECLYLGGDGANNVELAKIQNIRWLELQYCKSMKNVVRTSGGDDATVFISIEHLKLEYLPELQEICDGPISTTTFQNLNELELTNLKALTQFWKSSRYVSHFTNLSSIAISYCHSLRNLGQLSMAGKDCLPQLQQLVIGRCKMMEQVFLWNDEEAGKKKTCIESQRKCNVITKVFPKLKEVELVSLPKLTTFYKGIEGIEFPLLREMNIKDCPKMKSIIESCSAHIDEDDCLHLLCQPQNISFSSLHVLEINHNPFCGHEIPSLVYNALEVLKINKYEGNMSLFTLSIAANLLSLRVLCIANCYQMIKVIEDEEQQERILLFPKLEMLELRDLSKLVSFCEWKCEVEFPSLREVEIERCPNMENFSMGFVATPNLEAFTTDLTTYVGVGVDVAFHRLKELEITRNENPLYHHKISVSLFNGLEKLIFYRYQGSMSLFTVSAVGNLVNLRVLQIKLCDGILVNVIGEDEKVVNGGERTVVFPKLVELTLHRLPNLVSFCEWKCDVEFPSLAKVVIQECPIMENFSMGFVAAPNLKIVEINYKDIGAAKDLNWALQKHYLARRKVSFNLEIDYNPFYGQKVPSSFCNGLEVLTINKYVGSTSIFTLAMAANLVSLRELHIMYCDEMIKVIEDEQQERILLFPKLEILELTVLPKLASFCGWQCEVELPLLRKVMIYKCPNMENLRLGLVATPNLEAFRTDLTTYVGVGVEVAFNNLKELMIFGNENPLYDHKISVSLFNGLEKLIFAWSKGIMSLFSSLAVGNLVNLKILYIGECDELLVKIIKDEEEEDDVKVASGGEITTVVFPKLEELGFYLLPKLVRFCEWKCDVELPSLRKVVIIDCPNMENFSLGLVAAPNLKIVKINEEEIDATKDLNGALQQHYLARQEKEINEEEEISSEEKDEVEVEEDDQN